MAIIVVSQNGKVKRKLNRGGFKGEYELRDYFFENPDILPIEEIKENARLITLVKEFRVDVGSIDILGIDGEGDLYIIETKLYKNPDKRQVLAQVLDYGASLSGNPDLFIERINEKLSEQTGKGLREKLMDVFEDVDEVIDNLKQNISYGVFRFIILMDIIPQSLKNLILYMNQNSEFSIYAIELEYYQDEDFGYQILIPN